MNLGSILGSLGGLLGGAKKTGAANEGGGLQDIIAGLDLSSSNPQDIIAKFQNGELSLDQAQGVLKQLAETLGLQDKLGDYLNMLKK